MLCFGEECRLCTVKNTHILACSIFGNISKFNTDYPGRKVFDSLNTPKYCREQHPSAKNRLVGDLGNVFGQKVSTQKILDFVAKLRVIRDPKKSSNLIETI